MSSAQLHAFYEENIRTNHCYVMFFVLTFLFGSTLQGGWVYVEAGQVGLVLDKKLHWNVVGGEFQLLNRITILITLGALGMAVGSQIGGKLLPKYGSRKLLIVANCFALAFNLLKLVENTMCILTGRFMFGVMIGMSVVCLSRAISDTVPAKNTQQYGAFLNGGFNMGVFFSNFLGLLVPLDNGKPGDVQKMLDDEYWRLVFGFPIILEVLSLVSLIFIIKHDSIVELLQTERADSELLHRELRKVYRLSEKMNYTDLAIKLKGEIQITESDQCTIVKAFTSEKHRHASFNAICLALANQMSGISGVLAFQTLIFYQLKKNGKFNFPIIWAVQINNFFNMMFCCSYSALSKYFRQKRALLFSQTGIVLCLFAIVLFKEINQSILLLATMVIYICLFQYGLGTISFIHIFETNVDSIVGLANFLVQFSVFLTQIMTPILFEKLGQSGFFIFFGCCSSAFLLFTAASIKDTSYVIKNEETGEKILMQMTQKEKKELYMPDQFLQQSEEPLLFKTKSISN